MGILNILMSVSNAKIIDDIDYEGTRKWRNWLKEMMNVLQQNERFDPVLRKSALDTFTKMIVELENDMRDYEDREAEAAAKVED